MRLPKIFALIYIVLIAGCTWQDAAKVTANAAVYSAMIATDNASDWNMHADLSGQAAGDLVDLAFNCTE